MAGCNPYQFYWAGLARTFSDIRLFHGATVVDNVKNAAFFKTVTTSVILDRTGKYHSERDALLKNRWNYGDV
jgi:ABC-type branched-subunit amino acid transport system ATPase component